MNQKNVSCDQMMQRLGYYCVPTVDTYGVCLLKAADIQNSLMVCVPKAIRLNTNNEEILPMRFQKDEEMLAAMNVGFTAEAEFIWVTPCIDLKQVKKNDQPAVEMTMEQLDAADFALDYAAMTTVEEAEPHEAECVLVRMPKQEEAKLTKLDQWRLSVLKTESLYYQETEDKIYVILTAGFINVVHVAADKKQEFDPEAFYEENAKPYRERYQNLLYDKPLDEVRKLQDEERMEQKMLPERREEAEKLVREIEELKAREPEIYLQVWTPQTVSDVEWNQDKTAITVRGEEFALTKDSLGDLRKKLDDLKQQMTVIREQRAVEKAQQDAENARLARIQAFRDVITICEFDVTVEDYAGKLVQSRPVKVPFLKIKEVRVIYAENEVRIEVWQNGKQLGAETTRYDYNDTVTAFQARLKKLLKAWPYCYREDSFEADLGLNLDY